MTEHTTEPSEPIDRSAPASAEQPTPEAVEEFERLAVLRMGGEDIEGAIDALADEEARDVAEVAIDRVVRNYENL
ncbi:hypothetical protein FGG90_14865 [Clavibacter tessellarius]|uniref:Uncharacterized protein n=1 Tax=Clavibacter tessellarius TaxID=31965 RepID=A0A225CJE8_9MICO|nr:hypothetical protein [Clavibacter michiganensis]OQJ61872.1 hypothetical protein B5P24_01910 [Clavibacter michiganensis subsp. tessellarius]UKF35140.1 hypothetical protein FGG90_14865 [Clavibacter michiganensis subsp. tessellarius]